ncbi:AraC family transcriptional regulator [Sphingomonas fuzhouensis]|uniref:AraC family transcriptional regulator n=1 Tax=Sphingomonas fuzhouensis TaxID=3106033 RepID=UPI002AFDC9A5|nr:AraC family transcriptional regulator [Sphingomonas sp. SGZ-02]
MRQIARADIRLSQVRRAIAMIRDRFDQPIRSESLVEEEGMSPASFHRHFRTVTAMSPLQYQKSLRLQEARRLIIAGRDVVAAGYAVGYESASQFSREYTLAIRPAALTRREGTDAEYHEPRHASGVSQ